MDFRYIPPSDYEVEGDHFNELARAEMRIRELLKSNKPVVLYKDGKAYAIYKLGDDGIVSYRKIKQ